VTVIDRFRLDGKVAVITGASSGLGQGFAQSFSDAGAAVVLGARREDALTEVAQRIAAAGGAVVAHRTDVTDAQDCAALAGAATDAFGRLDILVNNARIGAAVHALRETPEEFRGVIEVNLLGAFFMAQACARLMSPGSSIVNVASVLGLVKSCAPQAFDVRAWRAIDQHERSEGKRTGRPRVKLVDDAALLAVGRLAVTEQHVAVDCGMSTR
jgi:NAD(P)-dependent dehydrogenase (short-subunit alcohol dehydrogenase family)